LLQLQVFKRQGLDCNEGWHEDVDWKGHLQIKLENCSPDDYISRATGMAFFPDGLERFGPGLEPARTGMDSGSGSRDCYFHDYQCKEMATGAGCAKYPLVMELQAAKEQKEQLRAQGPLLPAFIITFANAGLFGWVKGAILSWSSAMAGAMLCYAIARIYGRTVVEKFTTRPALKEIDKFFDKYGKWAVLVARLLPFVSFDIVSYAAGLTSMGFWGFFWATGLGQLPATIIYSYVGGMLTGGTKTMVTGLLILFALTIVIFVFKQIWQQRSNAKADNSIN
jgi:uncharacterized membrane protein YdjX (TVP38/TMEM64 family)